VQHDPREETRRAGPSAVRAGGRTRGHRADETIRGAGQEPPVARQRIQHQLRRPSRTVSSTHLLPSQATFYTEFKSSSQVAVNK